MNIVECRDRFVQYRILDGAMLHPDHNERWWNDVVDFLFLSNVWYVPESKKVA